MDRLFIIRLNTNGHYDGSDIVQLNDYLDGNSDREITEIRTMPNGEVFIVVTD